jgi:hypothetical protein
MSDAHPHGQRGPFQPLQGRRRAHRPISLEGLPTPQELDHAAEGDDAVGSRQDKHPLYTPQQIEQETRTVRLDVSFNDVIKIRDQCEMIMAGCRAIMEMTRKHDLGSLRQRIEARREAASLGAALTLFNGKTPYGYTKKRGGNR